MRSLKCSADRNSITSPPHHLPHNRNGRWGTTDNFIASFLHFSFLHCSLGLGELQACPFPDGAFLPLPLPCLLPPFAVPCKMALARPDERETWPYHCSLRLFTIVRRSSCGPIACWILARTSSLVYGLCMRCVVSCGSTSFPWLVFFFGAQLLSLIHIWRCRRNSACRSRWSPDH